MTWASVTQFWSLFGPLIGAVIGIAIGGFLSRLQAERTARLSSELARAGDREKDVRAMLRSRLDGQHAAYAELAAYCAKHIPNGETWSEETRNEATAVAAKISAAFSAPEFADEIMNTLLVRAADWRISKLYTSHQVYRWADAVKDEMQRCIRGTEEQIGLPEVKVQPVAPPESIWSRLGTALKNEMNDEAPPPKEKP